MKPSRQAASDAIATFLERRDYRSCHRMIWAFSADRMTVPPSAALTRRLAEAILLAAESPDWRVAAEGFFGLDSVPGHLARKADLITRGLLSRYKSVRCRAYCSLGGPRLARMVLSRLEALPIEDVVTWDVLMAIDDMTDYLPSPADRARLVRFVKRLEAHGTRSFYVSWKIDETLYSDLHLNQRIDDSAG
jgi:hypothetical protein